ncbi:MAG TPA: MBL fold metallo-hydrolase [Vicinamibacterales bacterium]|jgi:cyclase|nr:MBL fold metallo-hydrolase [Vicinamibacterales bacterium]
MKNRLILLTILGVALAGGTYVRAQFGDKPAKLDVVKLKDDLFVIHNDYVPGNTTVMVTNEGLILVDDKFEIDHASILAELKKISSQPVKYVINTHHHGDHSGGNAKLQALGAQVVTSWQARQNMVEGKQPGLSNLTIDNKASLYLGGKRVDLFYFGRGHTNGDIVALFPAQRVLASGDLFTIGDTTPELVDYPGGGSAKQWPQTIEGVLSLDFDQVVPGHGTVGTKADMRKFHDTAVRLRTRVHDMIVQKKSKDEIAKMLTAEFHYAEFHLGMSLDGLLVELR